MRWSGRPPIRRACPPERSDYRRVGAAVALVAVLLTGCVSSQPPETESEKPLQERNRFVAEDISVVITSGTQTLRDVRAAHAVFHEEAPYLEATNVTLRLRFPEKDLGITAEAARGEVFLGTEGGSDRKRSKPETEGPSPPIGLGAMKALAALPRDQRQFGDVILHGPLVARSNDGGTFSTQTVIWSEKLRRLVVPSQFTQELRNSAGGTLTLSGPAFEVDSTLREWTYYADDTPWLMKWRTTAPGGRAEPSATKPRKKGR